MLVSILCFFILTLPNHRPTTLIICVFLNNIKIKCESFKIVTKKNQKHNIRKKNLKEKDVAISRIYNSLGEIKSTFRALKTDLYLPPFYYKKDNAPMKHLLLGLLGYWIVKTIRLQINNKKLNQDWKGI